jgi:hypothetical protein
MKGLMPNGLTDGPRTNTDNGGNSPEMSGAAVSDRHLPFQSSRSRQSHAPLERLLATDSGDRGSAETVPSSSRRTPPGRNLQFTNPFISSPTTKTP